MRVHHQLDFSDIAQPARIRDLESMRLRAAKAYQWIEEEITICGQVFPPGHPRRAEKIGARVAVRGYLYDVIALISKMQDDGGL